MTKLAVVGHPVAHSLSPAMHRAALDALGRPDVSYEAIDVVPTDLASALARLRDAGFVGLNVTLPHKTSVIAHVVSIDDAARAIGAVNTLSFDANGWVGTNTDVIGLARSLAESGVAIDAARVVVLGAGGAARASVVALAAAREVIVVARRAEAATRVAALHARGRPSTFAALADAFSDADLVIQASSATLGADADAFVRSLPLARLTPRAVVVDLVYRPRETVLLSAARARGLRVVDGVGMLVHQGAASLERWIGRAPPVDVMRAAVERALG